jgi:hypothetical protein
MTLLANTAPTPSARCAVSITAHLTPSASIPTCAPGRLLPPHPHVPVLLAWRTQAGPTQRAFLRAFSAKGFTHSQPKESWALGSRLSFLHALNGMRVTLWCERLAEGIQRPRERHSKASMLSMRLGCLWYQCHSMPFKALCPFNVTLSIHCHEPP